MADIDAYLTRKDVVTIVGLLAKRPADDNLCVDIAATTVDGLHEEPVSLARAFREIQERRDMDGDDFNPGNHPELFAYRYVPATDEDDYTPVETYDPEADADAAREIIAFLQRRFGL